MIRKEPGWSLVVGVSLLVLLSVAVLQVFVLLRPEPAPPYTFGGERFKIYEPVESPICAGDSVVFPLQFHVEPPNGEYVTVEWDTSWHREDSFGLAGSQQTRKWVYYREFDYDFGLTSAQPPDGVGAGIWTLVGHGLVNGTDSGGGYQVTVEYKDCDN